MSEVENLPEYEIGIFARNNLSLKTDDASLTTDEVDENRRRLQDYRKQLEAQLV